MEILAQLGGTLKGTSRISATMGSTTTSRAEVTRETREATTPESGVIVVGGLAVSSAAPLGEEEGNHPRRQGRRRRTEARPPVVLWVGVAAKGRRCGDLVVSSAGALSGGGGGKQGGLQGVLNSGVKKLLEEYGPTLTICGHKFSLASLGSLGNLASLSSLMPSRTYKKGYVPRIFRSEEEYRPYDHRETLVCHHIKLLSTTLHSLCVVLNNKKNQSYCEILCRL